MRVLARRTLSGLMLPEDEQAQTELRRVPFNKPVYIEIKAARNPKQHKLLFGGLLRILVDHDVFPSIDAGLIALKFATGHVDSAIIDKNGDTRLIPRSINYANMKQSEFAEWFDAAIKVVVTRWLPGVDSDTLRNEIEAVLR
jgi:hypothetical protein